MLYILAKFETAVGDHVRAEKHLTRAARATPAIFDFQTALSAFPAPARTQHRAHAAPAPANARARAPRQRTLGCSCDGTRWRPTQPPTRFASRPASQASGALRCTCFAASRCA